MDARHPYLDQEIQCTELNAILRKLKTNKAPGPDGITNEFLRYLPHEMKNQLINLMNLVMQRGETPGSWGNTNTIMIYKKGNKARPKQLQGYSASQYGNKSIYSNISKKNK